MRQEHRKVIYLGLVFLLLSPFFPMIGIVSSWPDDPSWIWVDWDKNEDGSVDDWRDVEEAYYQYDGDYLYLRLKCYDLPGSKWPSGDARYKWFIDTDGNMYTSGGSIVGAEYVIFVEDRYDNGTGILYLSNDPTMTWPPADPSIYQITDPTIGGWRIVSPYYIDMYVNWTMIGSPSSYGLDWATDQENPNLNQMPTTDHRDEEVPIRVHDVAAISQEANETEVTQGDIIEVTVVVENRGMQNETFDVTYYIGLTVMCTQRVTDLAAGSNITLTFYCNTSLVPIGTHNITALADSSGEITEINETNNLCTAEATIIINPAPYHDLGDVTQAVNSTIVIQGDIVEISVDVSNLGNFTESFNVTCYYDSTPIETQRVTDLAAGSTTTLTFYWDTSGVTPGIYFITAFADSSHEIMESNENNNNCTAVTPVEIATPQETGYLQVEKILNSTVSGPDPAVVNFTTIYEIIITVANPGGSNITNVTVIDTISPDVTLQSIGTPTKGTATIDDGKINWTVGTLEPQEIANLTFCVSLLPNASGIFTLDFGTDLEASGRDQAGAEVTDTGDHDVNASAVTRDVMAFSQTPLKTTVIQGEIIGIDVVVNNTGDYYTESFNVTCYYDSTPIGTLRVYNFIPGNSTTLRFYWDTSGVTPGTYNIKAKVDSDNEIEESNEDNNLCNAPASVKIEIHDVAAISQTPNSTSVVQGQTVSIDVVVKNLGSETESFNVTCYYDSTPIDTQRVTNLANGSSTTLTFYWDTSGVAPGIYYITAFADSSLEILDSNETNNWCTAEASVEILIHDVAAITQAVNSTIVIQGDIVEISVDVSNLGNFTESFNVTCYYDSTPIETQRVTDLAAGSTTTLTFYWDTSGVTPGTYNIKAKVDSDNEIEESNEDNNLCNAPASVTVNPIPSPPVGGEIVVSSLQIYTMVMTLVAAIAVISIILKITLKKVPTKAWISKT